MSLALLYTFFGILTSFGMLVFIFIGLFIGYYEYRGLFEKAGFGYREVGLLLVGASFGMISDIPLIVRNGSLMALNLGGAIIPVILSIHILRKTKIPFYVIAISVLCVSVVSYMTSSYDPTRGVVSEFPFYLLQLEQFVKHLTHECPSSLVNGVDLFNSTS